MLPITMATMLSLGFVSCSEIDDISYQPHMPINESHSFEGYDFLSVDAEKEWTWMTDRKILKEVAYPIPHNEHPSHKKLEVYGDYVVEKKGKLIYVKHPLISNYQYPDLLTSIVIPTAYIDIVKAAKAYQEDKYDIQDDPDAEHLEWMLGLRKNYDNKLFKSKKTGNLIADVFQGELGEFVNSMASPSISNWLEQISNDGDLSREDCKFLYAIERHDETSFDYIYIDQDGKSSYIVRKSYECDYDLSDLNVNNARSLTNLYDAVKNSIKYKLVDCPTSISIDLYPKGDESLLDDNYQPDEAIFKYKFHNTYNYPDGFTGFKKNIRQVLLDSLIQHYEEKCKQYMLLYGYDLVLHGHYGLSSYHDKVINNRESLNMDSLYNIPILYNSETGEASFGDSTWEIPSLFKENNTILALNIYLSVNGETIVDVQIEEGDEKPISLAPDVIEYHGIKIENKTLEDAIRKGIQLMPQKEGTISFMSFPLFIEVTSTYVDRYLQCFQDSVKVSIKEWEERVKKIRAEREARKFSFNYE